MASRRRCCEAPRRRAQLPPKDEAAAPVPNHRRRGGRSHTAAFTTDRPSFQGARSGGGAAEGRKIEGAAARVWELSAHAARVAPDATLRSFTYNAFVPVATTYRLEEGRVGYRTTNLVHTKTRLLNGSSSLRKI